MRNLGFSALLAALFIQQPATAADYSGQARVIDGDTFSIRQQRIRIAAIDACERDQKGWKNGAEWACGVEARQYLARMIDGRHVTCKVIDKDQYRRLVGQCFIQQTDIGLEMIKAGHAMLLLRYLPSGHPLDLNAYHNAEGSARERRAGMWAAEIEVPGTYRRGQHQN
ncbi:thermonuclease family protein (plasmid) [Agrobacterium tumefaciens]|nr:MULTISPECIES: thermonuclease family protein [Agrobacterium]QCL77456.1 thermonuclease family protein [Agrobacterium tumefaciens]